MLQEYSIVKQRIRVKSKEKVENTPFNMKILEAGKFY